MKYIIVLVLVLATVYAELDPITRVAIMAQFRQVGTKCVRQEGASLDDLNQIISKQLPTTRPGQCLIACFNENFGIQSPDGYFNREGALRTIEIFRADADIYNKMQTVVENCGSEVLSDGDRCNTGVALAACGRKVASEIGLVDSIIF